MMAIIITLRKLRQRYITKLSLALEKLRLLLLDPTFRTLN